MRLASGYRRRQPKTLYELAILRAEFALASPTTAQQGPFPGVAERGLCGLRSPYRSRCL